LPIALNTKTAIILDAKGIIAILITSTKQVLCCAQIILNYIFKSLKTTKIIAGGNKIPQLFVGF